MQPIVAVMKSRIGSATLAKSLIMQANRNDKFFNTAGGYVMNIEIANRLVNLRKQNSLSQEALAEKLGISRQAVSKWERAEASPDTDNLILLSRIYGISMDELLRTEDEIPMPENAEMPEIEEAAPAPAGDGGPFSGDAAETAADGTHRNMYISAWTESTVRIRTARCMWAGRGSMWWIRRMRYTWIPTASMSMVKNMTADISGSWPGRSSPLRFW